MEHLYLCIATRIFILKKEYENSSQPITTEMILEKVRKFFCLELYDRYETKTMISLNLKENILKEYLYDFLYERSYDSMYGESMRKELMLLKVNNTEEIMYMIQNHVLDHIRYCYLDDRGQFYLDESCNIHCEGLCFFDMWEVLIREKESLQYMHFMLRKGQNLLKETTYLHFHF